MPFDCHSAIWNSGMYKTIGKAVSSWKDGQKEYESVVGILVDVKTLMQNYIQMEEASLAELVESII